MPNRYPMTIFALTFLISSLAAFGLAAVWAMFGPGRYTLVERLLYAPVYTLSRILWRVELEWIEADPNANDPGSDSSTASVRTIRDRNRLLADRIQSGAVLVANHRCSLDPFFIQLIAGTRVHWMVAGEYFKTPLVGSLLRAFQAIPTNRGGVDTASTKRSIALAKQGKFVGMFPEGRINRTTSPLLSIRPGAALVALRAGVPIIPIWIEGAPVGPSIFSALFMPAKVRVIVGTPDAWGLQFSKVNSTKLDLAAKGKIGSVEAAAQLEAADKLEAADNGSTGESAAGGEPANLQREQRDRSISNQWIHRVMLAALRNSGRNDEAIALAGKKWLDE